MQKTEFIAFEVSQDAMEAFAWLLPTGGEAGYANASAVKERLIEAGICHGIDSDAIGRMLKENSPGEKFLVAKGKAPVGERDGELKLLYLPNFSRKPKLLDNGKVDYKQMELIKQCQAGQELATRIMPSGGEDGMDVFGNAVPKKKGTLPPPFPSGRNVILANDGMSLIAGLSGQVSYEGGRINVSQVLEIKGDVDQSTGSIDFIGSVKIYGGVMSGFSVKASGDVLVGGIVESAAIESGRSVVIGCGIHGGGAGFVKAKGDVTAKFIERANITAGGSVTADSVLHSWVSCGADMILSGANGLLVGGKAIAARKVAAKNIGSTMSTATEIEVGQDPGLMEEYSKLSEQYQRYRAELGKCGRLAPESIENGMDERKKVKLVKALQLKMSLMEKLEIVQAQLKEILPELTKEDGVVEVSGAIRHGAKVMIGNAVMYVRSDLSRCFMVNEGGRVVIKDLP
jgi:uncharacterized protein (DUF342 family)